MNSDNKTVRVVLIVIGIIPVTWAALVVAPFVSQGLAGIIAGFTAAMKHPPPLTWCEDSMKTIVICLVCYGLGLGVYYSSQHNYRRGMEHGSAKWGSPKALCRKYADKMESENVILTENVRIGLNGRKHRRNLNILCVGGSGSGKTRHYAKVNILQANTSFLVLDVKGEILRDTGRLLAEKGYEIRVFDLVNMEKSHGYNPLQYLRDEKDVLKLVTNLVRNTTPKGAQSNDPFWERAETALLEALILYLKSEAPADEQNFPMIMEMISAAEVREEDEGYASVLDELFERLEMRDPENLAVKQYHIFKLAAGKTAKSILISLGVRLEKFNLSQIASIVTHDELDLPSLGTKKVALFAIIPDNDSSLNFLIGMLYTQLFQELFYLADHSKDGRLPVHVHCVMDEFANVALPDDFDKLLSTMRSREVSASIILQNIAQLKALFEKQWESIIGNCDEFLYLGGNEQSTHKYVAELLGKETIDVNTYGKSSGRNGNYSTNYQLSGRELLDPSEVRMLDNRYALLFIRGERPIRDEKYDILKHPNIVLTTDGGAPAYIHGQAPFSYELDSIFLDGDYEDYDIFSEEEVNQLFENEKENNNE